MKRKRLSAGEIRFRVSKKDLARIEWILDAREGQSTSSMLRSLIYEEWLRTQPLKRFDRLVESSQKALNDRVLFNKKLSKVTKGK